jgi:DNA polymerase
MTAEDKRSISDFLDLAEDAVRLGYRTERRPRAFSDDAAPTRAGPRGDGAPRPAEAPRAGADDSLERIAAEVCACASCRLAQGRTRAVPGEGVERPSVLVVGEGPGADEDSSGRPFVGKAGQLLDKMLLSIGLSRETNCFIANVVKCRPPNNRDPEADEVGACAAFMDRQIALLSPRAILSVGRVPTQALLKTSEGIGRLRGRFVDYRGIPLLPTYHPSAILRDENLKRPAWEDLKLLRDLLSEPGRS